MCEPRGTGGFEARCDLGLPVYILSVFQSKTARDTSVAEQVRVTDLCREKGGTLGTAGHLRGRVRGLTGSGFGWEIGEGY